MRPRFAHPTLRPAASPGAAGSARPLLRALLGSQLLRRFAVGQLLLAFASTLLKFQLDSTLQTSLGVDRIAAFLGLLNLAANGGVLGVQLGLESRLLRAFGLTLGLVSTAFVLSVGAAALLLFSGLHVVAMLRLGEHVARFSVARTANDLVLLPVASDLRRAAQALVATLLVPMAVLLASLLLALASGASARSPVPIMLLTSLAALAMALALRAPYRDGLRDSLRRRRLSFGKFPAAEHDETVTELLAAAHTHDATLRLGALRTLARKRLSGAALQVRSAEVARALDVEVRHGYRIRLLVHALVHKLARAELPPARTQAAQRELDYHLARTTERVFLWLMLVAPPSDMERAYLAILRGERHERAFALEMLEQTLAPELRRIVVDYLGNPARFDPLARAEQALGTSRDASVRSLLTAETPAGAPTTYRRIALYLSLAKPETPEEERLMTSLEEVFALRTVELLSDLSPEELGSIAEIATRKQVAAEEVVFRQGDPGNAFYVVLNGTLRVERNDTHVATLNEGEGFGELALLDRGLRSATIIANTECLLLCIIDEDFRDLLERFPSIAIHMLAILARRSAGLLERTTQV